MTARPRPGAQGNRPPHAPVLPMLAAAAAVGLLSLMDGLVKTLSLALGTYNAMLGRVGISLLLTSALAGGMLLAGRGPFGRGPNGQPATAATQEASDAPQRRWPDRATLWLHVARGVTITLSSCCFFYATTVLPLAVAIGLTFIAPLIALALAALWLREQVGAAAIGGALLGLIGVALILSGQWPRAGMVMAWDGIAAVLASAVLYGLALVVGRKQAQGAGPVEVALAQSVIGCLLLGACAPWLAIWPPPHWWPMLAASAMLGVGGMLLFAWAYARAEARMLVPLEYSAFPWAALVGWVMFGEPVTMTTIAGAAVIITGCMIAARQKRIAADPIEVTAI